MSSVEERIAVDKSGPPGEPGKTFDELFDWPVDDDGVPYWRKGPASFEYYLQKGLVESDSGRELHGIY
jgi:hypothetical protein